MAKKRPFYTTREVAEEVGVSRATLQQWILTKQIEAPPLPAPGLGVRLWSENDLERVKAYKELVYRKGRGDAGRLTVKFQETVWRLNERRRELTDGSRIFRFHPVGTYPPGAKSKIVPIAWQEKLGRQLVDVTDQQLLQSLNTAFRFIYGRLRHS